MEKRSSRMARWFESKVSAGRNLGIERVLGGGGPEGEVPAHPRVHPQGPQLPHRPATIGLPPLPPTCPSPLWTQSRWRRGCRGREHCAPGRGTCRGAPAPLTSPAAPPGPPAAPPPPSSRAPAAGRLQPISPHLVPLDGLEHGLEQHQLAGLTHPCVEDPGGVLGCKVGLWGLSGKWSVCGCCLVGSGQLPRLSRSHYKF